jgi:hypothetical protein
MTEPLTNAILASILHLIRRGLAGNMRAPPRWVPPRRVPAHRCHRRQRRTGPRAVTSPLAVWPMETSPPTSLRPLLLGPPLPPFNVPCNPRSQVDLGRLVGPPKGITPFMVARPRRAPAEEERGQPAVEPLIRGTTDLTISDRPATPYHRADLPSPTPDTANPNSNGLGSGLLPQISLLGNRVIRRVIRLPTSTRTQLVVIHQSTVTDARLSDSTVRRVRFCH